jgi:hypothetical protein
MKKTLSSPLVLGTLLLTLACGPEQERTVSESLHSVQQAQQITASYSSMLGVPLCSVPTISCDSGSLLTGRSAWVGPEINAPNTLQGSCADGTSGSFHYDESVDRLKVINTVGYTMTAGSTIQLQGSYWAGRTPSADSVDLYYAPNAEQPIWQYLTTLTPRTSGAQSIFHTFTLQMGGSIQAVRAQIRYGGNASPCDTSFYSFYNDVDDLAFVVQPPARTGISDGGFEATYLSWSSSGNATANQTPGLSRTGAGHLVLQPASPNLARVSQSVMLPLTAQTLQLYYRVESTNPSTTVSNVRLRIIPSTGSSFDQAFASNSTSTGAGYALHSVNIARYAGQRVQVEIEAFNNFSNNNHVYRIDDVSVQ